MAPGGLVAKMWVLTHRPKAGPETSSQLPGEGTAHSSRRGTQCLDPLPAAPPPDVEVGKEGPGWLGENRQGSKAGAPQPATPDADRREMCGH